MLVRRLYSSSAFQTFTTDSSLPKYSSYMQLFLKLKKNVKTSLISSVTQSKLGPGGLFSTSLVYPFLVLIVIDRPGRGGRLDGRGWGWGDRGVLSALPGRVPSLRIGFLFESCVFTSLLVSGFPYTALLLLLLAAFVCTLESPDLRMPALLKTRGGIPSLLGCAFVRFAEVFTLEV